MNEVSESAESSKSAEVLKNVDVEIENAEASQQIDLSINLIENEMTQIIDGNIETRTL